MNRFHYDPDHDYDADPLSEKQHHVHRAKDDLHSLRHQSHEKVHKDLLFRRSKARVRSARRVAICITSTQRDGARRLCNVPQD